VEFSPQSDTTERSVKDLDVMLGAEAAALILDDTAGVWPRHGGNLLQPRRYIYFPADHARWAGRFSRVGFAWFRV
jgi:hypothetical protein